MRLWVLSDLRSGFVQALLKTDLMRDFGPSDCTLQDVQSLDAMLEASRLSEHRRLALLLLIHSDDGARSVRALCEQPFTAGPGQFAGHIDAVFSIFVPWSR